MSTSVVRAEITSHGQQENCKLIVAMTLLDTVCHISASGVPEAS
jgi:hypothetical protein